MPAFCNVRIAFVSALVVICIIIIATLMTSYGKSETQPYVDYMPSVTRTCPTSRRCGSEPKSQIARENALYSNLRGSNAYAAPEFMGTDQCCVQAKDSEPTKSIMKRSTTAYEGDMQEGTYTPVDDIEVGLMNTPIR